MVVVCVELKMMLNSKDGEEASRSKERCWIDIMLHKECDMG